MKKLAWFLFGLLAVLISFYPAVYFIFGKNFGLLSTKSAELLQSTIYTIGFYGHITLGGIALLVGWTQFSEKLRKKRIQLHRNLGKVYVFSVFISGICGFYIAQFATGGLNTRIAFSLSALTWFFTTFFALKAVKNRNIELHKNLMLYSYAVCFSAVTLRFELPLLKSYFQYDSATAYDIVAWISWVPNLFVAYLLTKRKPNYEHQTQ